MRISDWSSDVCSSDLRVRDQQPLRPRAPDPGAARPARMARSRAGGRFGVPGRLDARGAGRLLQRHQPRAARSEEHTSELQSLMRISYAVFCLKKKKNIKHKPSKN